MNIQRSSRLLHTIAMVLAGAAASGVLLAPARAAGPGTAVTAAAAAERLPGRPARSEDQVLQRLLAAAQPLWSHEGQPTPQATALLQLLSTCEVYGLVPADYGVQVLESAREQLSADPARFDRLLSRAAIRLLTHLHYGRVLPAAAGFELPARPDDLDVAQSVLVLAAAADVGQAVAAVEPGFYHYALLKSALAKLRAEPATADTAADERKIELTLERWRWIPPFNSPPIIVNIPQFRLFAFHTTLDRVADIDQMPVIVGKAYPKRQTPVFVGRMRYVVFRPYWDVPRSIAVNEILPQVRKNPGYLARNRYELVRGESDNSPVVPATPENIDLLAQGKLRVRQTPGKDNALGLVKLMFPNQYNVYLHSTPAQALFAHLRRDFSHGCIRVADPPALAAYALRNNPGWDKDRVLAAMGGGAPNSQRVNLAQPIDVMILYGTALATEAGPVEYYADIYGNDARLEKLLGLAKLPPPAAKNN